MAGMKDFGDDSGGPGVCTVKEGSNIMEHLQLC